MQEYNLALQIEYTKVVRHQKKIKTTNVILQNFIGNYSTKILRNYGETND